MKSRATRSRIKAYECLEQVRKRDAFADDVIDKVIDGAGLDSSDRAFATRLVLGVVSCRGTLDFLIDKCLRSPRDVKPDVRDALRISTYEIIYLGKSAHAAVDQGVELVRHVQPKATGLANAVLRKVLKAKAAFPFGDPSKSIDSYSLLHAFPKWLAERLLVDLEPDGAHKFMVASNEPAPTYISVSDLHGDAACTIKDLENIGCLLRPVEIDGIPVERCFRLADSKATSDGRFKLLANRGKVLVSDASAQLISQLACKAAVDCAQGKEKGSCLELCSGRGTKTILLQNAMKAMTGAQFEEYIALDNVEFKTRLLSERAESFGANVTESLYADILKGASGLKGRTFDLVFLDVPCSGLGTLRRHPEIRWRITTDVIEDDALRDVRLLKAASQHVSDGGVLAYSTCTVTRAEDELAVQAFLNTPEGAAFEPVPIKGRPFFRTYLLPGGHDAHFCTILRKKALE